MSIINLTQHEATPEQVQAGVLGRSPEMADAIRESLTFDNLPKEGWLEFTAECLTQYAIMLKEEHGLEGEVAVMIGGAPFLMEELAQALRYAGFKPCYAFSKRVSVEKTLPDGTVQKINHFKHEGFVA